MKYNSSADDDIKNENLRLKVAVEELSILNDIATAIASTQSLTQVTNLIVRKCVSHLKTEQGSIQLIDEKDIENPFHTMIRVKVNNYDPLRFDKQLSDFMIANKKPLLLNKFHEEEVVVLEKDSIITIRSLLSVPLIIKGKMIGILSLFNKKSDEGFTESDQRLLSIIAAQSANVIENSRLFEAEKKFIEMQQEMKVAGQIQKNILPKDIPVISGYEIYAINIPAGEVGGDYYDFININEDKTAIALGDVCGKGMPAAMLMANVQATLRGQLLFYTRVKDCITRANLLLRNSTERSRFVTLFFGILEAKENTLTYCNAGHLQPVVVLKDGSSFVLEKTGAVLGCFKGIEYDEEKVSLEKGSTLVIYSDGVTEAMNQNLEQYGEERLFRIIQKNYLSDVRQFTSDIINDVTNFSAGTTQSDDITLMILRRTN